MTLKELFTIDLKDYDPDDSVFRRPSARAVIIKNNIIALVYSVKEKYYKFPGGGIKDDEDMAAALAREVKEEAGLIVKPESISEFGSVMRRQKSDFTENTVFEQENYYFWCECEENAVDQNLDDYEKEAEFTLKFVDIDEAIKVNSEYRNEEWALADPRLNKNMYENLSSYWKMEYSVRSDFARRQLLIENDVLCAMSLGLSLSELQTIDDTQPGGPVERTIEYVAPFDRCDREKDYETAWRFFKGNTERNKYNGSI